jgi:hypothetical protein
MLKTKTPLVETNSTNDILKTILYFDTFQYPITSDEVAFYSKYSSAQIKTTLNNLTEKKVIYSNEEFYSTSQDSSLISRRKKGNLRAEKTLVKAKKMSAFISQFPFIEGVFLSGSISKGFLGENDDIDYFIITSPNRLWLSRTLLILYKKIFLLNSRKYFCVNYFMSSNALEIPEKNRFTATEFVTLVPMSGNGIYDSLKNNNSWVLDYFPAFSKNTKASKNINKNFIRRFLEFVFKGKIGDALDSFTMKITKKHQEKKFKKLKKKDFKIAFKAQKHVSKHHPGNHQMRVITSLNKSIEDFNTKHQLSIPLEK